MTESVLYKCSIDGVPYETTERFITGLQVQEMRMAPLSVSSLYDQVYVEGPGLSEDTPLWVGHKVDLSVPRRFYIVPPVTGG
jgi:hypothetical protein